jgi:anti-sigma factor RsiW
MCNQREKLIGYLYDECEAGERAAVQEHLESCADCRAEIASLRSVREDLATWEVPAHESVWRPFAPAAAPSWWQQLPRWALAAAASVVLASGAVGGAVTLAFIPPATQATATPAQALLTPPAEVVTLQKQIAILREELSAIKVQKANDTNLSANVDEALHKAFGRELAKLQLNTTSQLNTINLISNNMGQLRKEFGAKHGQLVQKVNGLETLVLQQSR